jgi:hypothetical protein
MTTAELANIMEQDLQEAKSSFGMSGAENACRWETADTLGLAYIEVLTDRAREWFDALRLDSAPYPGVGDDAYTRLSGVVATVEDDIYVLVQVTSFGVELDETAKAAEIAAIVLDRVD